jgi:uncharacterized membrane protein
MLLLACEGAPLDSAARLDAVPSVRPAECADAPSVTWDGWGEGFVTTWCQACHSATTEERNDSPLGVDFDTEADLRFWADSVRRTVLEDGTMPVGGGVSEETAVLLETLLDCGL